MLNQVVAGWRGNVEVLTVVPDDPNKYTVLPVTRWQATFSTELAEATAGTDPVRQWVPGYTDVEVSFDCLWFGGFGVMGTATPSLDLTPGKTLKARFFIDYADLTSCVFLPQVVVSSVAFSSGVREVVKYTVTGKQSSSVEAATADFPDRISYPFS